MDDNHHTEPRMTTATLPDWLNPETRGWSEQDYRTARGHNFSTLKHLAKSPAHYRYHRDNPDSGDTYSRGALRAAHCLALEPHNFDRDFAVYEGEGTRATKAYRAWAAEQEARNPRVTLLKASERDQAQAWADSVRAHPVLGAMLAGPGWAEVPLLWTDLETGLLCRGRVDYLVDNHDNRWGDPRYIVLDLKQLDSAHPRRVAAHVARNHWHVQAAHYADGVFTLSGETCGAVIGACEGRPPHEPVACRLDPDGILYAGEEIRLQWLETVKRCEAAGEWPFAYPDLVDLHLPRWAWPDSDEVASVIRSWSIA